MKRHLRLAIATCLTLCMGALGAGVATQGASASTATRRSSFVGTSTVQSTVTPTAPASSVAQMVAGLRVMNYFPSNHGWDYMWVSWDPTRISTDLGRIAALGANTVRVIITDPANFGYPSPTAARMAELRQMVDMATSHGLRVMLTLSGTTTWESDLSGSREWTGAVLAPFNGDPRIALVELQNEINPGDAVATVWAAAMVPTIRAQSGRPVTLSVTAVDPTNMGLDRLISALGSSQPDIYDIHYYEHAYRARSVFQLARNLAGATPLLVGETGYSTYASNIHESGVPTNQAAQEAYQELYYRTVEQAARDTGLPPAAPWILDDFPASPSVGNMEQHYGLNRLDGTAKPALAAVQAAFTGAAIDSALNWGFETGAGGYPADWLLSGSGSGFETRDTAVSRSGTASARISGSSASPTPFDAAIVAYPLTAVAAGQTHALGAWVRGAAATGVTAIGIQWFDINFQRVGANWAVAPSLSSGAWTFVGASGIAPAGAAFCRLVLTSTNNAGSVWFDDLTWH